MQRVRGSDPARADVGGGGTGGTGGTTCPAVECVFPGPTQITTYTELFDTLKGGGRVRVVLDYAKCTLDGQPAPNALGAMNMDTFEWFGKNVVGNAKPYIAASENHLISFPPGFVYDYVKLRVYDDQSITVGVQYLDPQTFAVSVNETIKCGFSDATTPLGATFFKLSQ